MRIYKKKKKTHKNQTYQLDNLYTSQKDTSTVITVMYLFFIEISCVCRPRCSPKK